MDPHAGPSNLSTVQRPVSDEAIPPPPQSRQPSQGSFANAHNFQMDRPGFYDVQGDFHQHSGMTEFDRLQTFISEDAFYDSKARFPPPKCYPETRVEVLKIITDWIDDPDPSKRIFWLNGPVGAGKSAITQTIAERCKDTQLAASFFFQRSTSDRGVADRLFLTLAWQLAMSIPEILPYLESTLKRERSIHAKSIDVQFDLLFVQVFEKLLRDYPDLRPHRFLIIIDAVDECATDQDQEMILALIGAKMPNRAPLRFLIGSRPEPHIKETFNTSTMKNVARALVLDNNCAPYHDIRIYLEGEFNRIFTERGTPLPPPIADILNHLVLKSSGQFIYASTVVKFIDDADHNPRKRLDIILGTRRSASSPYAQLDQLYIQILSQQQNTWLLKGVFVFILAFGQISLDKFPYWILRVEEEDLMLMLRRMHSLLHISDSGIRPYHLSLLDFLEDKKRAGKYYVNAFLVTLACTDKLFGKRYYGPWIVFGVVMSLCVLFSTMLLFSIMFISLSFPILITIIGSGIAIIVIIILAIQIRRKQKEAIIRGLLVEPAR